jgi:hypothetical protein
MRAQYPTRTHKSASFWLVAICFGLILVPPFIQAFHFHPVESQANRCASCQAISSTGHALPLVAIWTALTVLALVAPIVDSAPKQYSYPFSLLSRPPPVALITPHF